MQQWYKPDVVQRFYVYHTANTVLQLEDMKTKILPIPNNSNIKETKKAIEIRDFRLIEPVLTIIWMVSDNLGFNKDYVSYKLLPETISEFIKNSTIWNETSVKELLDQRDEILTLIDNTSKDIDFLPKNKLIFIFQNNIVENFEKAKSENKGKPSKYSRWFDFAQKTLKKDNSKKDFIEYEKDPLFKEIMRRLDQSELTREDLQYITDQRIMWEKIGKYGKDFFDDGKKVGMVKGEKLGIKKGKIQEKLKIAKEMLKDGFSIDKIQQYTRLTNEEIQKLI